MASHANWTDTIDVFRVVAEALLIYLLMITLNDLGSYWETSDDFWVTAEALSLLLYPLMIVLSDLGSRWETTDDLQVAVEALLL